MYESYYKLTADPFRLSPDHRFSFGHNSYAEAKAYLEYALFRGEGFIIITGGAGTGKTTLIAESLAGLDKSRIQVATLNSTQLEGRDLLHMVAASFGLRYADANKATLLLGIEGFLAEQHRKGQRCVLIVDEAQGLSPSALEELRLLANMQRNDRLLLQVFLVGQEQLRELVGAPGMEHLSQRIIAAAHLEPLNLADTVSYIEHRLTRVRWLGDPAISGDALRLIHAYSRGVPRRINLICSRLFLHGAMEAKHELSGEDARSIITDLQREGLIGSGEPKVAEEGDEGGAQHGTPSGEAPVGLPRASAAGVRSDDQAESSHRPSEQAAADSESAEGVRPMGRKSAWLEDEPKTASTPPLREAMGRVLDRLDEGVAGSPGSAPHEKGVRRGAAPAAAKQSDARRGRSGEPPARHEPARSGAGQPRRSTRPAPQAEQGPQSRSWGKLALFAAIAGLIFVVTSRVFDVDQKVVSQAERQGADYGDPADPAHRAASGTATESGNVSDPVLTGDSLQDAPRGSAIESGETLTRDESPAGDVETDRGLASGVTPSAGADLSVQETGAQGIIARAAPIEAESGAAEDTTDISLAEDKLAATQIVGAEPVQPDPAAEPSAANATLEAMETPATKSVPLIAATSSQEQGAGSQEAIEAEKMRLADEARQRFEQQRANAGSVSEKVPVAPSAKVSAAVQPPGQPEAVRPVSSRLASTSTAPMQVTPSLPKTAVTPVKPLLPEAVPAQVTPSVPKVAAPQPAPSLPKTASKPVQVAVAPPAPAPSSKPVAISDRVRAKLLEGRWSSRGKPASLLPSDITLCKSLGESIDCWSVPQNVNTKYGEALYKIEATLDSFSGAGAFKVSYRTLVKLLGESADSKASADSDGDGWQVSEHSMSCVLVQSDKVSCRDEQGVTRDYTR